MTKKLLLILLTLSLFSACATNQNKKNGAEQDVVEVKDRVFFDFNSYVLTEEAKNILDVASDALVADKNATKTLTIEGHCDERGTAEYNMALGQKRANAVKQYLVKNGVKANRIKVVSFGKEKPAVMGSGEKVWSQNRRAVMVENTK